MLRVFISAFLVTLRWLISISLPLISSVCIAIEDDLRESSLNFMTASSSSVLSLSMSRFIAFSPSSSLASSALSVPSLSFAEVSSSSSLASSFSILARRSLLSFPPLVMSASSSIASRRRAFVLPNSSLRSDSLSLSSSSFSSVSAILAVVRSSLF